MHIARHDVVRLFLWSFMFIPSWGTSPRKGTWHDENERSEIWERAGKVREQESMAIEQNVQNVQMLCELVHYQQNFLILALSFVVHIASNVPTYPLSYRTTVRLGYHVMFSQGFGVVRACGGNCICVAVVWRGISHAVCHLKFASFSVSHPG